MWQYLRINTRNSSNRRWNSVVKCPLIQNLHTFSTSSLPSPFYVVAWSDSPRAFGRYGCRKGSLKHSKSRRLKNLLRKSEICEQLRFCFLPSSVVTSRGSNATRFNLYTRVALRMLWLYLFEKKKYRKIPWKLPFISTSYIISRRGKNVKCPTREREKERRAGFLSVLRGGIDPPEKTAVFEFPNRVDV